MQYLLGAVVIALLVVGGWFFVQSSPTEDPIMDDTILEFEDDAFLMDDEESSGNEEENIGSVETDAPTIVELNISGENFEFSQNEIRVNQGDVVRINFTSTQGTHNFVIDELGVRTNVLNSGESEVVEFTASKAGTFEYYCSVGSHRQMGMVGTLIVE